MDPSWVILTICESWETGPNEASPATVTVHAPDRWEEDIQTKPAVKFNGQPPPNAPAKRRQRPPWVTGHFVIFPAISGHFRPPHSSFPPFLDPLNSFPWSFFPDSSPFERYDKNKFGRLLDRVFRPPQKPLDQGEGIDVFLVSWAFQ